MAFYVWAYELAFEITFQLDGHASPPLSFFPEHLPLLIFSVVLQIKNIQQLGKMQQ